jgi:hypothetical protein
VHRRRALPWGRLPAVTLLAAVLALALAAPAAAGQLVDQAAARLRNDPVWVHPAATPGVDPATAAALRRRVAAASTPIYLAVLPARALAEAAGSPARLAAQVAAATGFGGTYLVVAGGRPAAGSNTLAPGRAEAARKAAFAAHPGDLGGALLDFVGRVDTLGGGAAAPPAPPRRALPLPSRRAVLQVVAVALLLVLAVFAYLALLRLARRRRLRGGRELAEARAVAEEDLRALGADLRDLDADLGGEQADNPAAVAQHTLAYEAYERAAAAFEQANAPEDLAPVSTAIEAGRFAMVTSRALFEQRERPRRRPPCFFDTRHGPSVDDVGWQPFGASPRPVPACEACRRLIADGIEPPARTVATGGRRVPFYLAPPHFESWFGGYFGGAAADLVAGFPLGRALDDGFAGGLNTFGGGYGYLPGSYAETGKWDSGGAAMGAGAGSETPSAQEVDGEADGSRAGSR